MTTTELADPHSITPTRRCVVGTGSERAPTKCIYEERVHSLVLLRQLTELKWIGTPFALGKWLMRQFESQRNGLNGIQLRIDSFSKLCLTMYWRSVNQSEPVPQPISAWTHAYVYVVGFQHFVDDGLSNSPNVFVAFRTIFFPSVVNTSFAGLSSGIPVTCPAHHILSSFDNPSDSDYSELVVHSKR